MLDNHVPSNPPDLAKQQDWFRELLEDVDQAVGYLKHISKKDPAVAKVIGETVSFIEDHLSLLSTEAREYQVVFTRMLNLLQVMRNQRDEAIVQRDEALLAKRDAYLEGLLTKEEERLNGDWKSFGLSDTFNIGWLKDALHLLGEHESADKIAEFEVVLAKVLVLAEQHRQRYSGYSDQTDD